MSYSEILSKMEETSYVEIPLEMLSVNVVSDIVSHIYDNRNQPEYSDGSVEKYLLQIAIRYSSYITYDSWLKIITINSLSITQVPKEFRTIDMYDIAMEYNIHVYRYIPDNIITLEHTVKLLNRIASSEDVDLMKWIPLKFISIESVENAFVELSIKYKKLFLFNGGSVDLLSIQSQYKLLEKIPSFCKHANPSIVEYNHWLKYSSYSSCELQDVPPEYRSRTIKLRCVCHNPSDLALVPESDLTPEFLYKAVKHKWKVYHEVKNSMKTYELTLRYLKSMQESDETTKYDVYGIPKAHMTPEVLYEIDQIREEGNTEQYSD
jgi:hypothetical protein